MFASICFRQVRRRHLPVLHVEDSHHPSMRLYLYLVNVVFLHLTFCANRKPLGWLSWLCSPDGLGCELLGHWDIVALVCV